jgi:hypothetical protein
MQNKRAVIFYRESLFQSFLSDAGTFGCLILLAWISKESSFWSGVAATIGIIVAIFFLIGKPHGKVFYSKDELKKYVDSLK